MGSPPEEGPPSHSFLPTSLLLLRALGGIAPGQGVVGMDLNLHLSPQGLGRLSRSPRLSQVSLPAWVGVGVEAGGNVPGSSAPAGKATPYSDTCHLLCPQPHLESLGSSSEKTLPSVTEAVTGDEPGAGSRPRRPLLLPNLSPAQPRGSLVSLLGEELPPFSALISSPSLSPSPSPALAGRGHSPSSQGPVRCSAAWKPPQLLIPPLGTFGPPDLSPR